MESLETNTSVHFVISSEISQMMFSKVFSLKVAAALLCATLSQAQLAPGRYRIWNGAQSARSYPSGGAQGPFQTEITMADLFASIYEQWTVTSDGNGGYYIQSYATGAKAYAPPTLDAQVFAASNQQTSWLIEHSGNDGPEALYKVKIPFQDLLWTSTPRAGRDNGIFLKGSDGSASQRFAFRAV